MSDEANGNPIQISGVIVALLLLVIGGISTLVLWNLAQVSSRVDQMQTIVYKTEASLKSIEARVEQVDKQVSEQKGALDAALGHRR